MCLRYGHREHLHDVPAVEPVLEHAPVEPRAIADLACRLNSGVEAEVGVDYAEALALRACARRVRAEERRFDAVGLRERGANDVEQTRVGSRAATTRATDGRLVDHHDVVERPHIAVNERRLTRPGHTRHDRQDT